MVSYYRLIQNVYKNSTYNLNLLKPAEVMRTRHSKVLYRFICRVFSPLTELSFGGQNIRKQWKIAIYSFLLTLNYLLSIQQPKTHGKPVIYGLALFQNLTLLLLTDEKLYSCLFYLKLFCRLRKVIRSTVSLASVLKLWYCAVAVYESLREHPALYVKHAYYIWGLWLTQSLDG